MADFDSFIQMFCEKYLSMMSPTTIDIDSKKTMIQSGFLDDLVKNPEKFDGGKRNVRARLNDLENKMEANSCPDDLKLKYVSTFLDEVDQSMEETLKVNYLMLNMKNSLKYKIYKKQPKTTAQFIEIAKRFEDLQKLKENDQRRNSYLTETETITTLPVRLINSVAMIYRYEEYSVNASVGISNVTVIFKPSFSLKPLLMANSLINVHHHTITIPLFNSSPYPQYRSKGIILGTIRISTDDLDFSTIPAVNHIEQRPENLTIEENIDRPIKHIQEKSHIQC
ncbi:unnamed protein product [Didymodactylos carnosus]|uniref:Uncharacterized protein n=1 Tax=Didymodactylos carnosus TaxID=1234261 RepID=A0A8S2DIC3_9BILA|nr:unnamed protein product [Didymodactylos carnosus]CAF3719853.1 unnamed protein product [Didymodactylos carnosus]